MIPFSVGFDFPNKFCFSDYVNILKVVDILIKSYMSSMNNLSNNKFDYTKFLNYEENIITNAETIDIDYIECENVDNYTLLVNYTNLVHYAKKDDNDYSSVLKRFLGN